MCSKCAHVNHESSQTEHACIINGPDSHSRHKMNDTIIRTPRVKSFIEFLSKYNVNIAFEANFICLEKCGHVAKSWYYSGSIVPFYSVISTKTFAYHYHNKQRNVLGLQCTCIVIYVWFEINGRGTSMVVSHVFIRKIFLVIGAYVLQK